MYTTQNKTARKWHGLSVSIEIDFVDVWVVVIEIISMCGIGIDLVCVRAP